jgi:N-acetylmuramoyl-L-alanine amidase
MSLPRSATAPAVLLLIVVLLIGTACASAGPADEGESDGAPTSDDVGDGTGDAAAGDAAAEDETSDAEVKPLDGSVSPPATPKEHTPGTSAAPTPAPAPAVTAPENAARPLAGRIIALDPGHNGGNAAHPEQVNRPVDAGGFTKPCNTVGASTDAGYSEARYNLDVALLVRVHLEERGATVRLTRDTNDGVGPCIDERGRFGGSVGADVLVSIHADGAPADASGFHVIRPALVSGYTDGIVEPSAVLARSVRDALVQAGLAPANYAGADGIDVRGDLGTLNHSEVPAVLVETANMRNADDARRLHDPAGRQQIADGIATGIVDFLTR